jgi:hypothetical protein
LVLPSAAPSGRSGATLMVASRTPLPAGPLSTDGDLRGNIPRRHERESRKGEKNQSGRLKDDIIRLAAR